MHDPAWPATTSLRFPVGPGRPRARRLLLEQLRQAIATEPATLDTLPHLSMESLTGIRGRVSIVVGTIVVRLNREGFTASERIYSMRDSLAAGKPVCPEDVAWVDAAIAVEAEAGPKSLGEV